MYGFNTARLPGCRSLSLFTAYGVLLRAPGFTVRGAPNAAGTFVLNVLLIYSV